MEINSDNDENVREAIEQARQAFAEGDPEAAGEAVEPLLDMDCGVCNRMGTALGGIAASAGAVFDERTVGALCVIGETHAEVILLRVWGDI